MDIWAIFDRSAFDGRSNGLIVPLDRIVSTKNELLDQKFLAGEKLDPRQTAFNHMTLAAKSHGPKRVPLSVHKKTDEIFTILDGNATAQVLMLTGWNEVPVLVENS